MHLNVLGILTYLGIISSGKETCTLPDTSRRGSLPPIGQKKKLFMFGEMRKVDNEVDN